jgi:lipoate-protein ligase A
MKKLNIGQVLAHKEDIEFEGFLGSKKLIKAGTKVYVGADKFAHYLNGIIQPLGECNKEGYSVKGIADWVYMWVSARLPIDEFLDSYEISKAEFKEHIEDALEELGMWDNTGNRS